MEGKTRKNSQEVREKSAEEVVPGERGNLLGKWGGGRSSFFAWGLSEGSELPEKPVQGGKC